MEKKQVNIDSKSKDSYESSWYSGWRNVLFLAEMLDCNLDVLYIGICFIYILSWDQIKQEKDNLLLYQTQNKVKVS